jgi:hypothetical protein
MAGFLLIVALDVAGLFAVYFVLRARIRRFLELDNLLTGVRAESRALVMELNETAERNVSLVEDRIVALKDLLDEVDRRIGVAHRELETRSAEKAVYEQLSRRRPIVPQQAEERRPEPRPEPRPEARPAEEAPAREGPAPVSAPAVSAPAAAVMPAAAGAGPRLRQQAAEPEAAQAAIPLVLRPAETRSPRIPEIRIARESVVPGPTRNEEALELHRKGFSADIIAARLGATVAEIELLVEMEERRNESLVSHGGFPGEAET